MRLFAIALSIILLIACGTAPAPQPNVLWLYVEDMNANWGVYGETTVATPHIDQLAAEGVHFNNAFMPAGVCSPTRSALITGMYQTSIGAHNHRSSVANFRGKEIPNHHGIHLPAHVKPLPEIFRQAGYWVANGRVDGSPGKTDYNFEYRFEEMFDGPDWRGRATGQPFFAQIQLAGGKNRRKKPAQPVDPAVVKLAPYYPDHPDLRTEYADYLNTVILLDEEIGQIRARLETEGILDNTVIFLFTDHGNRLIRDKQFLYDGGIRVPLVARYPAEIEAGSVRDELVSGIDISASSLYFAGIPIPEWMEGRTMFGPDYQPREYIAAARDRCDYTIDRIRAIRTKRFKYIRNYLTERPYTQPQYRDGSAMMKALKQLYADGKMSPGQAWFWAPQRQAEELYDIESDPAEMTNLAANPEYAEQIATMRQTLDDWVAETGDQGQQPEHPDGLRDVKIRWPKQTANDPAYR